MGTIWMGSQASRLFPPHAALAAFLLAQRRLRCAPFCLKQRFSGALCGALCLLRVSLGNSERELERPPKKNPLQKGAGFLEKKERKNRGTLELKSLPHFIHKV